MKIVVTYFGQVKSAVGVASEEVEVEAPSTVSQLVPALARRHGAAAAQMLLGEDGEIQKSLLIIVNDEQVAPGKDPALRDGDRLTLMPPISGG